MFKAFAILLLAFVANTLHAAMPPPPPGEVVYKPGFDTARVVTEETLVIRAFTSAMADRKEYAGAHCRAVSDEFEISFMTPATVEIPRIQGRPSNLRIHCQSHRGAGQLVIRPSHPGHAFPNLNPLATFAFAVLATTENHNRDTWTYVPIGQTRTVTLQWATRPGCETTLRGVHCAKKVHPATN